MPMKEYSTFFNAPRHEPHHQTQLSVIVRTLIVGSVEIAEFGRCKVGTQSQNMLSYIFEEGSRTLRKERFVVSGAFHCAHVDKSNLWAVIGCWPRNGDKRPIGLVVDCSPIVPETGVQSQVESYQRLKKWYLIPPCLTLSIIKYVSRVKWSNPEKGVAPFPIPWSNSNWNGSFWVAPDYGRQLYFYIYVYTHTHTQYVLGCPG